MIFGVGHDLCYFVSPKGTRHWQCVELTPTMGKDVKYNPQTHICFKCFATLAMGEEPPRFERLGDARSLAEAREEVKTVDAAIAITHRSSC
jgi:hypothetical protein